MSVPTAGQIASKNLNHCQLPISNTDCRRVLAMISELPIGELPH